MSDVLASKFLITKGSTIRIQPPSSEEGVVNVVGIKQPAILFLNRSKASTRGGAPVLYALGWIVVADGKTVPYDVTNIAERRLYVPGSTYFLGSFRPRHRFYATKSEIIRELVRLSQKQKPSKMDQAFSPR